MAVINRVGRGVLSLLDAKTGGDLPFDLERRVSPGLDMTDFYLADLVLEGESTTQTGVGTAPQIGTSQALVEVPAGELWAVKAASVQLIVATVGGANYQTAVTISAPGSLTGFVPISELTPVPNTGIVSQEQTLQTVTWESPLLCGSGCQFGGLVPRFWPAVATLSTSVLFYRMKV